MVVTYDGWTSLEGSSFLVSVNNFEFWRMKTYAYSTLELWVNGWTG